MGRKLSDMSSSFSPHTHEDPRDSWPECENCGCGFVPSVAYDDGKCMCEECRAMIVCDVCGQRTVEFEWVCANHGLERVCGSCAARQEDMADALRDDRMDEAREEVATMREHREDD